MSLTLYPFGAAASASGSVPEGVASSRAAVGLEPALDPEIVGGKGAGLAEMTRLGLPVPPGFTIPIPVCQAFFQAGGVLPGVLDAELRRAVADVERAMQRGLGDRARPLLLSVRSGAAVSMPGMMDTVLNLGLNTETCEGLAQLTGDRRFAIDCYRRFVAMYAGVVLGIGAAKDTDPDPFDKLIEDERHAQSAQTDRDLDAAALTRVLDASLSIVQARTGEPFPQDPWEQLRESVAAVFRSWHTPRAIAYRRIAQLPENGGGSAANVQAMVFGNLGNGAGTGVAFTRDPATGEKKLYGEFLMGAQGEDVVAGIRTPHPIAELARVAPRAHAELERISGVLEAHFRDAQDVEFTIEAGFLWMLQTRAAKRTARAMFRIAADLVSEGAITQEQAVGRLTPEKLDELLHPRIDETAAKTLLSKGLPASPGAAFGRVVFTAGDAEAAATRGESAVLVRVETSPEDIHGMKAAVAILTSRGGMTSHAAVVARGMGKPCVVGASQLRVDYAKRTVSAGDAVVGEGDTITVDGSGGQVFLGRVPLLPALVEPAYDQVMGWVDTVRRLRVRANADTPEDARTARAFGAEGIGLCRTEHMFFAPERILAVRQLILADDAAGRAAALATLLPMQQNDFEGIFRAMDGFPVTIRLLDPPLHEFLPQTDAEIADVARALGVDAARVKRSRDNMTEHNPMLGHRGVRLCITMPELVDMQTRAIMQAACAVAAQGMKVLPEIMIPLVSVEPELAQVRARVDAVCAQVMQSTGVTLPVLVGTMIELPRACLVADALAAHAAFFSFGTNDLTQTTYGLSRDDMGTFLSAYVDGGLWSQDPFAVLDRTGVGALMELAVAKGRSRRPDIKLGICGEHGGEPRSIMFFHSLGLDYVSCSPFRLPIARVAAARAALADGTSRRPS